MVVVVVVLVVVVGGGGGGGGRYGYRRLAVDSRRSEAASQCVQVEHIRYAMLYSITCGSLRWR